MNSIQPFRRVKLAAWVMVIGLGAVAPASFAQSNGTTASPTNPAAKMLVPPGRAETPDSAFRKLDPAAKGFVSKDDTTQLQGFDAAFEKADANKDGKLSQSEFNQAWATYSGTTK